MTSKPESRLQRDIRRELKLQFPGSWWVKIHGGPYQAAGIPDILGCILGQFVALEVKMPDGSPLSKLQKIQISRIKKAGGLAYVVTSVGEAVNVVRRAVAIPKDRS
jgi:hypothetical protein